LRSFYALYRMAKAFHQYKNPSISVDIVLFGYHESRLSILLINRKEEPYADRWTLPGGFLRMEETLLQTCRRILKEKTGFSKLYLEQLFSFDALHRDPRRRVISIAYYGLINSFYYQLVLSKIANDIKWCSVHHLPPLGFDHREIYKLALRRLRDKILYFPIGFELLHGEFTLPELHDLYECILDRTLDRRNFRKKMLDASYILPTGKKKSGLQHRHPDLYKFNRDIDPHHFKINI